MTHLNFQLKLLIFKCVKADFKVKLIYKASIILISLKQEVNFVHLVMFSVP